MKKYIAILEVEGNLEIVGDINATVTYKRVYSCKEGQREYLLDKIKAEIEKTTSRYTISRERGSMGQVEWSDRLIKESDVLEIIDKYKAESEET